MVASQTPPGIDERECVRTGYDAISYLYRSDDADDGEYLPWLIELEKYLAGEQVGLARILDVGCGNGIPVCRYLSKAGYHITGVDISEVQIKRARTLVPERSTFIHADVLELELEPSSFEAIVCLYAVIHMPVDLQPDLFHQMSKWLKPGGILMVLVGEEAFTHALDNWLGGGARLWWSQADAESYRSWLSDSNFETIKEEWIQDAYSSSRHLMIWARNKK
ncbi:methyltransferase type 11 [Cladochytrium replicatum]|nr:methyltransferase type 11 [Cladochytrium replicatum]